MIRQTKREVGCWFSGQVMPEKDIDYMVDFDMNNTACCLLNLISHLEMLSKLALVITHLLKVTPFRLFGYSQSIGVMSCWLAKQKMNTSA